MEPTKHVAYLEDAADDSSSEVAGISGTRRYAISEAPTAANRPNTGKSRAEKRSSGKQSDESSSTGVTDSDSTTRSSKQREARRAELQEREQRAAKERRRKERKQKEMAEDQQRKARLEAKAAAKERESKPGKKTRPTSLTQSRTEPSVQQYRRGHVDDPSYFGIKQPAVSGTRPRAQTRPNSYYNGPPAGPPMAHAGWHAQHPSQPQAGFPVGSFPPPYGGPSPSMIGMPPPAQSPSFYDMPPAQPASHLRNRFDRGSGRPASAMGFRQPSQPSLGYPPDEYEPQPDQRLARRPSRSKKQNDEDRRNMPPPQFIPRPKSALPPVSGFRPPPPPGQQTPVRQKSRPHTTRRGVGFADQRGFDDEDYLTAKHDLFADISPEPNHTQKALSRTRRGSVAYEQPGVDIVPAGRHSRTSSFYHDHALGSGGVSLEEDKYTNALKYQDDINGGPLMPLTAEALRKASARAAEGASSRSTRSTESRDESDYRRSNTTGITRSSSSDNDNVTIKVSGQAVVRVQGAEIECIDGGEITFSSRPTISQYGSDRASTVYQLEDGRSRVERKALPQRIRAPSQSDSQSRGYAQSYAPSYAPYDPSFADDYI